MHEAFNEVKVFLLPASHKQDKSYSSSPFILIFIILPIFSIENFNNYRQKQTHAINLTRFDSMQSDAAETPNSGCEYHCQVVCGNNRLFTISDGFTIMFFPKHL